MFKHNLPKTIHSENVLIFSHLPASASPAGAILPIINRARQCFGSERRNVA
jgi:hypothetical protein